jgi:hypothetical protein
MSMLHVDLRRVGWGHWKPVILVNALLKSVEKWLSYC